MPQIEVKFDIDQNGILSVSAKDTGSGKEASVRIEESAGLSDDEINKMQSDADSHAEDDKKRLALATARNEAENMCYQVEKTIKEHEEKLSDSDKEPLTAAVEKTKKAAEGEDLDAIKQAVQELEQASHALSKMMYESAQSAGEGAEANASGNGTDESTDSSDDDAIDAEFEVKNES